MSIYEKPVRELLKNFVEKRKVKPEEILNKKEIIDWFKQHYPKIKQGTITAHLIRMSVNAPSRIHYNVFSNGADDLFYQIDGSHFRLYDKSTDPVPIYKEDDKKSEDESEIDEPEKEDKLESNEFAYERDLKNFLSKNLHIIEPDLTLYEDEGITGIEFPVGGRFIDILALDKNNNFVIIELKVSKGYDRVIGQILRYMAWIEKNLAEPNQKVKGIIIASKISDDLKLASSKISDITLYEYDLSISLRKITQQ